MLSSCAFSLSSKIFRFRSCLANSASTFSCSSLRFNQHQQEKNSRRASVRCARWLRSFQTVFYAHRKLLTRRLKGKIAPKQQAELLQPCFWSLKPRSSKPPVYLQRLHVLRELSQPFSDRGVLGLHIFSFFPALVQLHHHFVNTLPFCLDPLLVLSGNFLLQKVIRGVKSCISPRIYACLEDTANRV